MEGDVSWSVGCEGGSCDGVFGGEKEGEEVELRDGDEGLRAVVAVNSWSHAGCFALRDVWRLSVLGATDGEIRSVMSERGVSVDGLGLLLDGNDIRRCA